ncbi:MAG: hypothetical protein AUK47_05070 [Deltaproteobacteria bacterium CG2_30_63_29]|nr:MAG: hypothetical protein AUK47_05070 [Deltaproteobacteria bacterium CG2_30_63_29]PJB40034.1 MAG: Na+/H+ antiporter [Deltaproteobacteria bacterium CG_4_9_14_3_um_filter_63_12]
MIHQIEVQVLVLLLIASLVSMGARWLRLPYTLALVVAGLALGFVHIETLKGLHLTQELLLLLFLPPLLFEAAFHLPFADFRRNAAHILFLAVPGVLVSVGVTAGLAYAGIHLTGLEPGFGWAAAFLFASVIAATDPISVLALFKELGAPRRLYLLVEGESLLNDGVAVVVFGIVAAIFGLPNLHGQLVALDGTGEIVSYALVTAIKTGLGGALVGGIIGGLLSVVTRQVDDHLIEITLTTLVAWGSFLLAEQLQVSGVLSTVMAGIVVGSFGTHYGMSPTTRLAVQDFWEYMGFISNSFIFLLIGLELESGQLLAYVPTIAVAFASVLLGRAVLVYGAMPLTESKSSAVPPAWRHVLVWGGLRGSLSMVLILGLPADFAARSLLVSIVFGVVTASLFIQGLTMAGLMRRLGVSGPTAGGGLEYELARGQALASARVLAHADELREEGFLDEATHKRLQAWYSTNRDEAAVRARELAGDTARPERLLEGVKALAAVEQEAIRHAAHNGILTRQAASELLSRMDHRLAALDGAAHEGDGVLLEELERWFPQSKEKE